MRLKVSLQEQTFYHKVYGLLFDTIIELNNTGVRVDPVILQTKLKEKGAPPESYSNEFIRDLVNAVPTTVNAKDMLRLYAIKPFYVTLSE